MNKTWLEWEKKKKIADSGDFSTIRLIIGKYIYTLNIISKWVLYGAGGFLTILLLYSLFSSKTYQDFRIFTNASLISIAVIIAIYALLFIIGLTYRFIRNIFEFFKKEFYHDIYVKLKKNKKDTESNDDDWSPRYTTLEYVGESTHLTKKEEAKEESHVSTNKQHNKYGPSKSEDVLYHALRDIGLEPERQYKIGDMHVDFAFPQRKIVVEVDGHYHRTREQHKKDNNRNNMIMELGWKPIRITAEEVMEDSVRQAHKVKHYLSKKKKNKTLKEWE